jgi:hypothetical protein
MMQLFVIMVVNDNGKESNNSGQATFELIIFMPFFIVLFTTFIIVGSSINGAINQQKLTRGYYYYLERGNSFSPDYGSLMQLQSKGVNYVGMNSIGWKDKYKRGTESPVASCYRMSSFIAGNTDETCEEKIKEKKTSIIRALTVYGLCTANFRIINGEFFVDPLDTSSITGSCSLRAQ